jgi:hypothetical protein
VMPPSAEEWPLLALPEDEKWLTTMLHERFRFQLVHSALGGDEVGTVVTDPVSFLPPELPSAQRRKESTVPGLGTLPTYRELWDLAYWAEDLGPIEVRQQPEPPLFATQPDWPLRTMISYPPPAPLLRLRRSFWQLDDGCVITGGLAVSDAHATFFAAAVAAVRVECTEFDSRRYVPQLADLDDDAAMFEALPVASEWLRSGGGCASTLDFT